MRITGLITEYNPFHKGHKYHIEKAREITGADYVIAIMSGDFVQRGGPACVQKHVRAHMALVSGVDLVLELPIIYAAGSAEIFAEGAVSILDQLGVVNNICFGSECGDTMILMEIARILSEEPAWYQETLQNHLREGLSFPAARAAALPEYADILSSPNNILGIEYCKAITKLSSCMEPVAIRREGSLYHDEELTNDYPSATALRGMLSKGDFPYLNHHIPSSACDILLKEIDTSGIVHENDFSSILLYKLLTAGSHTDFTVYEDISEELASRMFKARMNFISFSQFADLLKTKELTRTRINRALLHLILGIKKDAPKASYARILGFKKESRELLTMIKKQSAIPCFSKTANANDILTKEQFDLFQLTTNASLLYEGICAQKNKRSLTHEHSKKIIII